MCIRDRAGGVNNFGTTIGPLLVSFAIFGSVSAGSTEASIESVKTPYLILGIAFVLVALFIKFSKVPNHIDLDAVAQEEAIDKTEVVAKKSAFSYPQLVMGMIGIFVYVGVEVSTASNLPAYLEQYLQIPTEKIAPYISLYWASLMIGRWTGAVGAFDVSAGAKKILSFVMPYVAFAVFLLVNAIMDHAVSQFYIYAVIIAVMIICDIASKGNPVRMLLIFSSMGILALLIGMFSSGLVSAYAFTSVGLFCSCLLYTSRCV